MSPKSKNFTLSRTTQLLTSTEASVPFSAVLFYWRRLVVWALLFAYLAAVVTGTLIIGARRQLWNDELFTYYIAIMPTFSDVWSTLLTGYEQTPPGYYAIVRLCLQMFDNGSVAIRVPSLVGFLVMSVALFKFVSR